MPIRILVLVLAVLAPVAALSFVNAADEPETPTESTLPMNGMLNQDMDDAVANMELLPEDEADEEIDETAVIGMATIQATEEGSAIEGEADFVETEDGLSVNIEVFNVPPGKHGFHIHENGSCADAGNAAGGHFNPDNSLHGMVIKDGHEKAHAGDFGNIDISEDGSGSLSIFLPGYSLTKGEYNVAGKAVVLHEKEDDFGQPTGNAGGRIGCGVIEVAE